METLLLLPFLAMAMTALTMVSIWSIAIVNLLRYLDERSRWDQ